MPDASIAAAILAGGRARRLGGLDKPRLIVGTDPSGPPGRTIIVRQVDLLQRIASQMLVVTTPTDRSLHPSRFDDVPVTVAVDQFVDAGTLGGIHAALAAATAPLVLVVGGDMPFLNIDVLRALTQVPACADGRWVRTSRGPEPLLACYKRRTLDRVTRVLRQGIRRATALGDTLVMDALEGDALRLLDPEGRAATNVNTPEDLRRVQSTIA